MGSQRDTLYSLKRNLQCDSINLYINCWCTVEKLSSPTVQSLKVLTAAIDETSVRLADFKIRNLSILLTDINRQKPSVAIEQKILLEERIKFHTCYVCMKKFLSLDALLDHKSSHSASEGEDDLFEEDHGSQNNKDDEDNSGTEEKVKNLNVLRTSPEESQPVVKKRRRRRGMNKTLLAIKEDKEEAKENKTKPKPESVVKTNSSPQEKVKEVAKTPFKCITCNVFFETSDDAKLHISPSAAKCKFSCHLCNRKFNTLYAFIVHVMQHKNDSVKNQTNMKPLYTCTLCDKNFADCFQLKRHEITIHKKKSAPEPVSTAPTEIMTTHVVISAPDSECNLTCDLCYDVFNSKAELDEHTEFHKQIDLVAEPIDYKYPNTKDDAFVEVIEDLRDKHEITTTFQAPSNKSINTFQAPSTASLTPSYKFSLASGSSVPNKKTLTATIKDMIAPKQSKTIFLPNIEKEKMQQKLKKVRPKFKVVAKRGPKPKNISRQTSVVSPLSLSNNETLTSQNIGNLDTSRILTPNIPTSTNTRLLNSIPSSSTVSSNAFPSVSFNPADLTSSTSSTSSTVLSQTSPYISTDRSFTSDNVPTISLPESSPSSSAENTAGFINVTDATKYAYLIVSNSSSNKLPQTYLLPTNPLQYMPTDLQKSTVTLKNSIPETSADICMPKIQSVMSLVDDIEKDTRKSDDDTLSAVSAPIEEPIVIVDSDSESEGAKQDKIASQHEVKKDSDEESNLVIDEDNQKSVKQEVVNNCETDDEDDHFEEEGSNKLMDKEQTDAFPKNCPTCNLVLQNKETFEKHDQKKSSCKECGYKCCKVMELKSHYLNTHTLFYCWRCEFTTDILGDFIVHRNVHTCSTCDGIFVNVEEHQCKQKISNENAES